MIDFHTHILPGIDDGSKSTDMSLAMLREEAAQGAALVCATPHFYANRMSVDGFLGRREAALEALRRKAPDVGKTLPDILPGAEVYYFSGIGGAGELSRLTLKGTNTLLLEMPFVSWDKKVYEDVKELALRRGFTVVLAHVERYFELQKNGSVWDEVFSLPVIPQINAEGLLGKKRLLRKDRMKEFCLELALSAPKLLLGSDCHNMETRPPNLKAGRDALADALGSQILKNIDETAQNVTRPVDIDASM